MDLWSGSEDDGRGVYLHIMYARFLLIAFILDGPLCHGQNDTIFPNVNAEFQLAWPCMEPPNNPYVFYENHTFEAQPAISMDGLEWGTVDPPGGMGLIAVDALRVFYHSLDGQHIPAGTTVVLYDFGLAIGDTAYWDEYYGFGHALLVQIDTVSVLGRDRRQFTLNNGDHWLEGIGSLMGLFRPLYQTPLGCADPTFTYCANYIDDDAVPYTVCSDMFLGASTPSIAVGLIHPNPSNGRFTVTTMSASGSYRVVDTRGSEIRRGLLQGNETVVDLIAAAPGLYVLDVNGQRTKLIIE